MNQYIRKDGRPICGASAFREDLDTPMPWYCSFEHGHDGDHVATDDEELSTAPRLNGIEYHRWPHGERSGYDPKQVH